MQWLIDLVIAAIGIPPCYIDRGQTSGPDFTEATLTIDNAWHELDLSGIVPDGASAVVLRCGFHSDIVNWVFRLRKHGTTMTQVTSVGTQQVAGIKMAHTPTIGISTDRKIDYRFVAAANLALTITVRGWFL